MDTWCKAIDAGYFTTWPGLTSNLVCKHLPVSIEMAKCHLQLARQHVQSTRNQPTRTPPPQPIYQPMMTSGIIQSENPDQENLMCMRPVNVAGQIFSDQTGRFPRFYSRGNRSVMVLYEYYSNAVLTEPLKNNVTS